MKRQKHSFGDVLRRHAAAVVLTAGVFALTYFVVVGFRNNMTDYYSSDYFAHILWALRMTPASMLQSLYNGSERLWHIFVNLLFTRLHFNMWSAAATVSAAANAAAYFIMFRFFDSALPKKISRPLTALGLAFVFVVNAVGIPGLAEYAGIGGVNPWHNPTIIMVRPFAAAVLYMTVRIYNRRRYSLHSVLNDTNRPAPAFVFEGSTLRQFRQPVYTKAELILYPLCLLLSCDAKPSFMQCFAPAIFLLLVADVIRTRGKLLPFCLKLAAAFIPAAIVILLQMGAYFIPSGTAAQVTEAAADTAAAAVQTAEAAETTVSEAAASGLVIYFIQQNASVGEILVSLANSLWCLLRLTAFPVVIIAAAPKKAWRDTTFRLSLLMLAAAWLETLFLHEAGAREAHGNFFWALYLSAWLLWSRCVPRYLELLRGKRSRARSTALFVGTPVLLWHVVSGVIYVIRVLQTSLYFY